MLEKSQGLVAHLAKARCLGWRAALRIWNGASNKPPILEPDPILEIDRRHDPEENIETTPPDDECVDLRGVWGVEFYTPAHVESLVEGFRKLGWDRGGRLGNPDNLVEWLRWQSAAFVRWCLAESLRLSCTVAEGCRIHKHCMLFHHAFSYLYSHTLRF